MEEKNRVKLKINGSEFVIIADESDEYIQQIAKAVDKRIKELSENDPKLSISMATILAALNYCDELEKERKITKELLKKADACEAAAKKAIADLEHFSVENKQLKEEKLGLHKVIEELKEQSGSNSTQHTQKNNRQNVSQFKNRKNSHSSGTNGNNQNRNNVIPKINYQGNDQINDQYRRQGFDDSPNEEEMMSFFDDRDT